MRKTEMIRNHERVERRWLAEGKPVTQAQIRRALAQADRIRILSGGSEILSLARQTAEGKPVHTEAVAGTGSADLLARLGITMIDIPAGKFLYGDDKRELELPAFKISRDLITNGVYAKLLEKFPNLPVPAFWSDPRFGLNAPDGSNLPVVGVSFNNVMEIAKVLADATGTNITIPTEEQAEKAIRGKDGRVYPWGNEFDASKCVSSVMEKLEGTKPVGSTGYSNQYGLTDPVGNVWIWTKSDWSFGSDYKTLRGGSWCNGSQFSLRSAFRRYDHPGYMLNYIGFRVSTSGASCFR